MSPTQFTCGRTMLYIRWIEGAKEVTIDFRQPDYTPKLWTDVNGRGGFLPVNCLQGKIFLWAIL